MAAQTRHVVGLGALKRALRRDMVKLKGKVVKAARRAAERGRVIAYDKAPVAFGELREGIEDQPLEDGARVRSTAPYSGFVEEGSRPHWPPLGPIIEWVKLRGTQGIGNATIDTTTGARTSPHPETVAGQIARHGDGTATPIDAPEKIARAICAVIAKRGTKPTWFMKLTAEELATKLDEIFERVLSEPL